MTQKDPKDWHKYLISCDKFGDGSYLVDPEVLEEWFKAYESKKETAKIYREQALKEMREKREIRVREQKLRHYMDIISLESYDDSTRKYAAHILATLYPDTP